ncbi:hypothetical protein niasHT_017625 [Heterodera trifolii]|uniref:Uncharacterized protein n=1 Tax=Heterodera trifolii TaxID=157864 RepID=A0ABD2L0G5_9BILA
MPSSPISVFSALRMISADFWNLGWHFTKICSSFAAAASDTKPDDKKPIKKPGAVALDTKPDDKKPLKNLADSRQSGFFPNYHLSTKFIFGIFKPGPHQQPVHHDPHHQPVHHVPYQQPAHYQDPYQQPAHHHDPYQQPADHYAPPQQAYEEQQQPFQMPSMPTIGGAPLFQFNFMKADNAAPAPVPVAEQQQEVPDAGVSAEQDEEALAADVGADDDDMYNQQPPPAWSNAEATKK